MNRRKELVQQYKELKTEAGVYCIRHKINGKLYIASTPNLASLNGRRFELQMGVFKNKQLQQEWSTEGEDAFDVEVLEVLKKNDSPFFNMKEELGKLEQSWLERLQPYGEKGYMSMPRTD